MLNVNVQVKQCVHRQNFSERFSLNFCAAIRTFDLCLMQLINVAPPDRNWSPTRDLYRNVPVFSLTVASNHLSSLRKFLTKACSPIVNSRSCYLCIIYSGFLAALLVKKAFLPLSRRIKSNLVFHQRLRNNTAGFWHGGLFGVVLWLKKKIELNFALTWLFPSALAQKSLNKTFRKLLDRRWYWRNQFALNTVSSPHS